MLSSFSPPRAHPPSTPATPGAPASTGTTPANSPRLAFLASCLTRARGAHDDDDEDSFISTDLTSDLSSAANDDEDFDLRSRSLRTNDEVDDDREVEEEEEEAPYWSHSGIDAYVRSTGAAMALEVGGDGGMLMAAVKARDGEAWYEHRDEMVADGDGKYGVDNEDRVEDNDLVEDTIAGTGITIGDDTMRDDDGPASGTLQAETNGFVGDELVLEVAATDHFVHSNEIEFVDDRLMGEDATTEDTKSDDVLDPEAMADDDDARVLADLRSIDDDIDRALADWAPYGTSGAAATSSDEFCAHPPVLDPDSYKHDLPTFLLAPHIPAANLDDTEDDSDASDDGTTAHDRALPLPLHRPIGTRGITAPGRRHASWPLPAPPPAISATIPLHVRFASGPRGASPRAHARRTASAPVGLLPRQVAELIAGAAAHDPTAAPGVYLSPLAGPRVAPVVLDGAWRLDRAVPGMASSESDPGSGSDADGWMGDVVLMLGGPRSDDEDPGAKSGTNDDDDDGENNGGGLDPEPRADPVEIISPRATSWSTTVPGTSQPRRRSRTSSLASSTSTLPPYAASRSRTTSPPRATLRTAAAAWFPDGLITAARVRAALRPPPTSTPGGLRPVIPIPRLIAALVAVATVAAMTVIRVLAAAARSGAPVAWSTPTANHVLRIAAPFAARVPVRLRRVVAVDGPKVQAIVAVAVAVLDGAVALGWAVEEGEMEQVDKVVMLGAAAW
ncbi:hypothetical protein AMAG_02802 [Allomyces macrogynus ATCC 38327]|uniref:Uncharacterized protein n=1 Tax=Allomyces macrogynus (strain ATCC 38327) TaxID=578462 RepID=A0A0L0S3D4_ALLM3|nr:hypothetical protein AMAG_02802 [Allomyces macrogynus ATCC 38327]|eukprot:KNE57043.1 hypothetical protein AMAG_02802 [Allomyces macrogynus ATCC 38327]